MRLKGIVKIQIIDINGIIKDERIQENLIPDASWVGILASLATQNYFGSRRISIATDNTTPVASISTVSNVIGTCSPVTPSPTFTDTVDPPFGTLNGRISPTGVSRIFNSVALTGLAVADTQAVASTTAYARLLLALPCTQGENDFVNITYSIQFLDNVGSGFLSNDRARYDLGKTLFGIGQFNIRNLYCSFNQLNSLAENTRFARQMLVDREPNAIGALVDANIYASTSQSNTNFKFNYKLTRSRSANLGVIFNALTQGVSQAGNYSYTLTEYEYDKEPFQTGFKHGSLSNIPFFDAANPANSQAKIYIAGTWTGKLPEFYKVDFTSSGAVGVATYKFSVFKHVGLSGNTFTCTDSESLYRYQDYEIISGIHGWRTEDFDVHRLSNTEIVQYDISGISVVDIFDGTITNYDATTTPALTATNIRSIAVDTTNRLVYVACRATGLWEINLTSNTVTLRLNQPCYGVDVGRNNVAVAIVNGGLYQSTDWVNPASFTFVGITDGNWDRVLFLKADPSHINDRIAIVANNGSGINRIIWYQFSDNTSSLGYENANLNSYPATLDVSDEGSLWILYIPTNGRVLTYGTNTLGSIYAAYSFNFVHSIYGTQNFSKVTFYRDSFIGNNQLFGGSFTASYTSFSLTSFALHLDSGLTLTNTIIRQILNNNLSLLRTEYGWDGSTWVAGNPNSKTTHLSTDTLINGLTIRFEDGGTTPHFLEGEFFTQGINYGLLKDNATNIEINTAWFSKTMNLETIVPTLITTSLDLPAKSDPLFRRLDTDANIIHRFFIDGVAVTKIWLDGTSPAPTEVSMLANGNGTLTFNVADVGKTLTGRYSWLEV